MTPLDFWMEAVTMPTACYYATTGEARRFQEQTPSWPLWGWCEDDPSAYYTKLDGALCRVDFGDGDEQATWVSMIDMGLMTANPERGWDPLFDLDDGSNDVRPTLLEIWRRLPELVMALSL